MAQRKALVRYIPKNYNMAQLNRPRKKDKDDRAVCGMTRPRQSNVRMMLPMDIKCATCQDYNHAGSKFGMRMEVAFNENYLGIQIYRFYFNCAWCFGEIVFKTDPKNYDYVVEAGGARVYDPARDYQQATSEMQAIRKDQEENNAMLSLENRTYDSKREMELMEHLEAIREHNRKHLAIHPALLLSNPHLITHLSGQEQIDRENEQFDEEFDRLKAERLKQEEQGVKEQPTMTKEGQKPMMKQAIQIIAPRQSESKPKLLKCPLIKKIVKARPSPT